MGENLRLIETHKTYISSQNVPKKKLFSIIINENGKNNYTEVIN